MSKIKPWLRNGMECYFFVYPDQLIAPVNNAPRCDANGHNPPTWNNIIYNLVLTVWPDVAYLIQTSLFFSLWQNFGTGIIMQNPQNQLIFKFLRFYKISFSRNSENSWFFVQKLALTSLFSQFWKKPNWLIFGKSWPSFEKKNHTDFSHLTLAFSTLLDYIVKYQNSPLILGDFSDTRASPTCLFTPVLVPPVKIQAPVVFAAFKRPRLRHLLILGWRSKLTLPPVVVISNLGLSRHHSLKRRLSTNSGVVS